jgi:hypothetical protein
VHSLWFILSALALTDSLHLSEVQEESIGAEYSLDTGLVTFFDDIPEGG